jgi:hypothetical protein
LQFFDNCDSGYAIDLEKLGLMKIKTLSATTIFLLACVIVYADTPTGTDLTGHVTLPKGKSAAATVLVRYAQLKTNVESSISIRSPILPKRAQTDRNGNFKVESLDARWLYFGYVMAPGCKLQELNQIDPAASPLNLSLETADTNVPPDRAIHGRVIDANGNPVSGALIDIEGTTRNGQGTWPGYDIDYFSVSDAAGNFVVYGKTPFAAVDGKVEATGYAETWFEQWPSDAINQQWFRTGSMPEGLFGYAKPLHQITLVTGASLQGRLLHDGNPVVNAEIRLNQCAAGSNCWFWDSAVLTDDQGRFLFAHLPPNQSWSLCGSWDLTAIAGAVPQTSVQIGENGSTNDIGDLNLKSVSEVAGRIHLSDSKPIPANSHYFLSDAAMGSSPQSSLGPDGSFHFAAVPGDKVSIFLRVAGYQLTPRDFMLKSGTVTNITVVPDMTNLVIEMKRVSITSSVIYWLRAIGK